MLRTMTVLLGYSLLERLMIFSVARPVRNLACFAAVVPAKKQQLRSEVVSWTMIRKIVMIICYAIEIMTFSY